MTGTMICLVTDSLLKRVREFHYTIKKDMTKPKCSSKKAKDNVKNANLDEYISIEDQNFFYPEKT
jgi:putative N6-adenine-specific DNA methylase